MWLILALASSVFAALTSILAKIGINGVIPIWLPQSEPLWFCSCPGEWCSSPIRKAVFWSSPRKAGFFDSVRFDHRRFLVMLL